MDGSHQILKIFHSFKVKENPNISPGKLRIEKNIFEVACKNGYLSLTEVQLEGKRKMDIHDFLHGYNTDDIVMLS